MAKLAKRDDGALLSHLVRSKSRCLLGRSREDEEKAALMFRYSTEYGCLRWTLSCPGLVKGLFGLGRHPSQRPPSSPVSQMRQVS